MKSNDYCVNIYDDSLRQWLVRERSEVRLAASVIQPGDLIPAFEYADYEELFPLPTHKLCDPEEARFDVLFMLDAMAKKIRGGGIPIPREDMMEIRDWIAPEATEMATDADIYGVGASITVHIKIFTPELRLGDVEAEDDADNPVWQDFQEAEVIDDDYDDGVSVEDSPDEDRSPGNVQ